MRLTLALLVAGALAAAGTALARPSARLDEGIRSVALGGKVHALVVLPPDYATSGKRYPVVYFLHGLPAGPTAYRSARWLEDDVARLGGAILVRPQGARPGDTDPEYRNWGAGRDWETYVARELPAYIDAHFRTIANRRGRAIMGLSAGGYGAAAIGLAHLDRFSVVESWSGYFHPTDPTGWKTIAAGPHSDVHRLIVRLAADERRRPTFLGFYVGRGDDRFRDENEQLNRELNAARIPHAFTEYPGGHETSLWRAHALAWLRLGLRHLAPAA
ncbi:MAG TPA: alpha/beta hydrolase-fold protein [Gaiellaceae bacterium]|nr:alpha/beta hydrolase-fold protein [Gaiellaceae bacterium]